MQDGGAETHETGNQAFSTPAQDGNSQTVFELQKNGIFKSALHVTYVLH